MTQEIEELKICGAGPPRDVIVLKPSEIIIDENFCLLGYRIIGQYKARRRCLYDVLGRIATYISSVYPYREGAILKLVCGACGKEVEYKHIEDIPLQTVPCCSGHTLIRYESPLV